MHCTCPLSESLLGMSSVFRLLSCHIQLWRNFFKGWSNLLCKSLPHVTYCNNVQFGPSRTEDLYPPVIRGHNCWDDVSQPWTMVHGLYVCFVTLLSFHPPLEMLKISLLVKILTAITEMETFTCGSVSVVSGKTKTDSGRTLSVFGKSFEKLGICKTQCIEYYVFCNSIYFCQKHCWESTWTFGVCFVTFVCHCWRR